jgi:small subunit ribosomal protein S16
MLKIRLRRVGAKKQPSYRIVVADSRAPRDGRFIETIGFYNPRTSPETVRINEERALYWLSQGAQPTESLQRMLEKQGTLSRLARLKAGEPLAALLAEVEAAAARPAVAPAAQPAPGVQSIEEASSEPSPEPSAKAADQG